MKTNRFYSISCIRAITCLLVVLSHVVPEGTLVHSALYTFHMPLFMSVSGFLFGIQINKSRKCTGIKDKIYEMVSFAWRKGLRLIVPFIVVMYCFQKPIMILGGWEHIPTSQGWMKAIIQYFSLKTTGHLWYLYVLFILFMIEWMVKDISWKDSLHVAITGSIRLVACILGQLFFSGPIHHVLMYDLFFWVGTLMYHHYGTVKKLTPFKIPLLVATLICLVPYALYAYQKHDIPSTLAGIMVSLMCIVTAYLLTGDMENRPHSSVIQFIDRESMGIYLFHPSIIRVFSLFIKNWAPLLRYVSSFAGSIVCAIVITELLRFTGLGFVLGERKNKT